MQLRSRAWQYRQFVEARRKHNHKTAIQLKFVRTRRNDHEAAAAHELFRGILDAQLDYFHDCLAVDWSDGMGQTPDLYYLEQAQGERLASCQYFETGLQIQSDGKVGACCWDYNLTISDGGLGDVAASSVLEVWQSGRRAALRERLAQPELTPEKCQKCIILHKSEPPADALMKIPVGYLAAREPTKLPLSAFCQ